MSEWFSRDEVLRLVGLSDEFLRLLEAEALLPAAREGRYPREGLDRARVCWNLHDHLGVNLAGIEVALRLLDRLHAERRQFIELLELRERLR